MDISINIHFNKHNETSGQGSGIGKHSSPPYTTTSKLQLKYRKTITQNHQKSN